MNNSVDIAVLSRDDLTDLSRSWSDPHNYVLSGEARRMFINNPCSTGSDPAQLLAIADRAVVGRINVLPGFVWLNQELQHIYWASGFVVHSSCRGVGIGSILLRHMQSMHPLVAAIGASAMSFPMFKREGWIRREAPRTVFVRNSRPVLEAKLGSGVRSSLATPIANAGLSAWALRSAGWGRYMRGYKVDAVDQISDEFIPSTYSKPLVFPRDARWLQWAASSVVQSSERGWQQYTVSKTNTAVGYFTLSFRLHESASRWGYRNLRLATVKDWQSLDGRASTNELLVRLAVTEARKSSVDAIEVCPADNRLAQLLLRSGAFRKGMMPVFVRADPKWLAEGNVLPDPYEWDFRSGDGDYFLY